MRATSIAAVPAQGVMMAVPVRLMPIVPVMCEAGLRSGTQL